MFRAGIILLFPLITFLVFSCSKEDPQPEEEKASETIGAWTKLNKGVSLPGWESLFAFQNGDNIYTVFQDGALFAFNARNFEVEQKASFPLSGTDRSEFIAVYANNRHYVYSTIDNNLYSYFDNTWTIENELPFYYPQYGGYTLTVPRSGSLYFLRGAKPYRYNLTEGNWIELASIPEYYENEDKTEFVVYERGSVTGAVLNGIPYLLTSGGDVFQYDFEGDQWHHVTKFPGSLMEKTIGFSAGNKLYFGLSHVYRGEVFNKKWMENELWSYNVYTGEWVEEQNIPFDLEYGKVFTYFYNNKLYLGHAPLTKHYHLYCFDPNQN